MAGDLSALEAQVAANESIEQSAITLINGIAAQLAAIANDPVEVAAMLSSVLPYFYRLTISYPS